MNKTVITVSVLGLAAVGLIGSVFIFILKPDAAPTFIGFVGTVVGLGLNAAIMIYGLNRTTAQLNRVEKQVNGNMTATLAALPTQKLTESQIHQIKTATEKETS